MLCACSINPHKIFVHRLKQQLLFNFTNLWASVKACYTCLKINVDMRSLLVGKMCSNFVVSPSPPNNFVIFFIVVCLMPFPQTVQVAFGRKTLAPKQQFGNCFARLKHVPRFSKFFNPFAPCKKTYLK